MPAGKLNRCLAPEYKSKALALGQLFRFVVVFSSLQFVIFNMTAQQP